MTVTQCLLAERLLSVWDGLNSGIVRLIRRSLITLADGFPAMSRSLDDEKATRIVDSLERPLMLGTKLERVFRLVGVKRAAKLYEAKTGRSCGCDKRKEALNRII